MTRRGLLRVAVTISLTLATLIGPATAFGVGSALVGSALAKDGSDDSAGGSGGSGGNSGSGGDSGGSGSGSGGSSDDSGSGSGSASSGSGSGGDGSGHSGPGSDDGVSDGSDRGSRGAGPAGAGGPDDRGSRSGEPIKRRGGTNDAAEVIVTTEGVLVRHRDGWREEVIRGIYRMRDPRGRLVISRPADHSDYRRMQGFRRP